MNSVILKSNEEGQLEICVNADLSGLVDVKLKVTKERGLPFPCTIKDPLPPVRIA